MFTTHAIKIKHAKNLLPIVLGAFFLLVCSNIYIPIYPVPFTLQTFAVYIIGYKYPPKKALFTLLTFLTCYMPFISTSPLHCPTFGYLIGMIFAVTAMAYLSTKKSNITKLILSGILGYFIIHIFGVIWLSNYIDFSQAIVYGVLPFIVIEIFKLTAAISIIQWRK